MNYTLTLNRKDADNTLEIFRFFARQTKRWDQKIISQ
jgi:hypothetical protein